VYDLGVETGINPAIALAFFIQESSAGTDGIATRTNSWGNIRATDPSQPQIDGFRAYGSFKEGVADWYRLIDEVYLQPQSAGGFGAETLSQVINIYAPASDGNDPAGYVSRAIQRVEAWERDTADERAAQDTATV
jgi:hypothetical protein